jgi:cysteine desulfurase
LNRWTTEEEIYYTTEKIITAVNKLRAISPLWDMIQEGIDLDSIEWPDHH